MRSNRGTHSATTQGFHNIDVYKRQVTVISVVQKTRVDLISVGFTSGCHKLVNFNDFPLIEYDNKHYAIRVRRPCIENPLLKAVLNAEKSMRRSCRQAAMY